MARYRAEAKARARKSQELTCPSGQISSRLAPPGSPAPDRHALDRAPSRPVARQPAWPRLDEFTSWQETLIVRLDDGALGCGIRLGTVPAEDLAISRSDPMGNPRMRSDVVVPRAKRKGIERCENRSTAGIVGNACRSIVDLAVRSDRGGKTAAGVVGKMDGACVRGGACDHDGRERDRNAEGASN
jgi:hypothetical protein